MKLIKYCIPLLILLVILVINEYISIDEGFLGIPGTPKLPMSYQFGSPGATRAFLKFTGYVKTLKTASSTTS